ncbi:MAG: penicillin-binding transpeptidase domain-containing protein, partial [Pseudomonadota bacterium]
VELPEAGRTKPILPTNWSELSTMTISYGHGIAATPLHLATAYASLLNGGHRVTPSLLHDPDRPRGPRIIAERTSRELREMLFQVVERGTASFGKVEGYPVGGKTGTADKPNPQGGYFEDRVIATFAAAFPIHDPKYVLVVTLDEPEDRSGSEPRRTAGWTAVPVTSEIIRRIAPLMNLRPSPKQPPQPSGGPVLTSN